MACIGMKKLHKDRKMQNNKHSLVAKLLALTTSLLVIGCSVFGGKQAPETIPLPPKNLNNSAPIMLPQPGNAARPIISESAAAMANESQATRFKRITEQRSPGGAVNKITVDNPSGGLPDYTLTPNQQDNNTSNNPDKITTPSWGWGF
jgi:hypothetical protein